MFLETPPIPPVSIIAAEHTAQLTAAQSEDVFSKAEEHELLFQDFDLGVVIDSWEPACDRRPFLHHDYGSRN